jgi:hypothetical protein
MVRLRRQHGGRRSGELKIQNEPCKNEQQEDLEY